jgi:hypothetical protein
MRWSPLAVLLLTLLAGPTEAQLVRGQVVDSLTGNPVPQSVVLLVNAQGREADRTVADARGFYLLRAPTPGRYQLVAEHEGYGRGTLPPFELESEQMRSFVLRIMPLRVNPVSPEPRGDEPGVERCPGGVPAGLHAIMGMVTDPTGQPVPGARVLVSLPAQPPDSVAEWTDMWGRLARETDTLTAGADGWYAACGMPRNTRLKLVARRAGETSRFVTLMFLTTGVTDGATFHTTASRSWTQHLGLLPAQDSSSAISGVVADSSDTGIPNVQVSAWGSDRQVRTDAEGRFLLSGLAPGSVTLQARLIGYQPAEYDVELGDRDTTLAQPLSLQPLPVRLSDVIIEAEAPSQNRYMPGFFERQRSSGSGRFLTMESFQRRHGLPVRVTEMINTLRGIQPGAIPQFTGCSGTPVYYLDGMFLGTGADVRIDDIIPPEWVEAIEAYTKAPWDLPFATWRVQGGCGVILIYSRRQ